MDSKVVFTTNHIALTTRQSTSLDSVLSVNDITSNFSLYFTFMRKNIISSNVKFAQNAFAKKLQIKKVNQIASLDFGSVVCGKSGSFEVVFSNLVTDSIKYQLLLIKTVTDKENKHDGLTDKIPKLPKETKTYQLCGIHCMQYVSLAPGYVSDLMSK